MVRSRGHSPVVADVSVASMTNNVFSGASTGQDTTELFERPDFDSEPKTFTRACIGGCSRRWRSDADDAA